MEIYFQLIKNGPLVIFSKGYQIYNNLFGGRILQITIEPSSKIFCCSRAKTFYDKLLYNVNDDTISLETINQNLIKVPKVFKPSGQETLIFII